MKLLLRLAVWWYRFIGQWRLPRPSQEVLDFMHFQIIIPSGWSLNGLARSIVVCPHSDVYAAWSICDECEEAQAEFISRVHAAWADGAIRRRTEPDDAMRQIEPPIT